MALYDCRSGCLDLPSWAGGPSPLSWTQRTKSLGNNEASAAQGKHLARRSCRPSARHYRELIMVVLNDVLRQGARSVNM